MVFIRKHPKGIVFKVFLQARSSKNIIVGQHGDSIKLKVTAPPVDGAANKALCVFLADAFGLPKRRVTLESGHRSRDKVVRLSGVSLEKIRHTLSR